VHSAFCLRTEGRLEHSPLHRKHIPRGELVNLLSKALLYTEVEAHWRGDALTSNCVAPFSIVERHVCSLDSTIPSKPPRLPPLPTQANPVLPFSESPLHPANGVSEKRKASEAVADDSRSEKKAKVDSDMELDSNTPSKFQCVYRYIVKDCLIEKYLRCTFLYCSCYSVFHTKTYCDKDIAR
jgi:transducin (beta)-like 1